MSLAVLGELWPVRVLEDQSPHVELRRGECSVDRAHRVADQHRSVQSQLTNQTDHVGRVRLDGVATRPGRAAVTSRVVTDYVPGAR